MPGLSIDACCQCFYIDAPAPDLSAGWSLWGWYKREAVVQSGTLRHLRDTGGNTGGEVGMLSNNIFSVRHYTSEDVAQSTAAADLTALAGDHVFWCANFNPNGVIDLYIGTETTPPAIPTYVSHVDAGTGWRSYGATLRHVMLMQENETSYWGTVGDPDVCTSNYDGMGDRLLTEPEIEDLWCTGAIPAGLGTTYLMSYTATPAIVDIGSEGGTSITTFYAPPAVTTAPGPVPVCGGGPIEVDLQDDLGATDALTRRFGRPLTAEALGLLDSVTRRRTRPVVDALGLLDSLTRRRTRPVVDPLGLLDSIARRRTRPVVDALGLLDTAARATAATRAPVDPLGLLDSQTRRLGRPVVDAEGLADTTARTVVAARTQADALGLLDAISRAAAAVRALQDPEGLTDSQVALIGVVIDLADPLGLLDSVARTHAAGRPQVDLVGLVDAAQQGLAAARAITDPLGLVDASSYTLQVITSRSIVDGLGLTDQATRAQATVRALTEVLGLTDVPARVLVASRLLADSLGLTDTEQAVLGHFAQLVDALGLTDGTAVRQVRAIVDALGLDDQVVVSGVITPEQGATLTITLAAAGLEITVARTTELTITLQEAP